MFPPWFVLVRNIIHSFYLTFKEIINPSRQFSRFRFQHPQCIRCVNVNFSECLNLLGMVKNCIRLLSFQVEIGLRLEVGFVLLSICALWQSDTCGIPLSRPVGPLIVQGSARLSPDGVEIITILCKRGANCEYFLGIVPGLLCLGV